jgi:membrane protein
VTAYRPAMGWWHFFKFCRKLVKQIGQDDLSGRAAEMAYKFFLALFPFLIFLVATGSFASDILGIKNPVDQLMEQVGPSLPDDAESVLRSQLENVTGNKNPALLSIGIFGSIWAASSGIGTVSKALNRILEVEEDRPMLKRYSVCVGLTIIAGIFVMASVVLIVAGQAFGRDIADELGLSSIAQLGLTIARYAVIAVLLLLAVAFVFWAAPAIDLPFRLISPGAVTFVLVWLPFTYLFGLYVTNFGSYNATYGTLGGVVVLLVWIYFSSFIFLIAAEVNAIVAHRETEEAAEQTEAKVAAEKGHRRGQPRLQAS